MCGKHQDRHHEPQVRLRRGSKSHKCSPPRGQRPCGLVRVVAEREPERCQQQPMRRERRVPDAENQRRTQDQKRCAQQLKHRVRGDESHQEHTKNSLQRKARDQPETDELKRFRKQRVQKLEEKSGDWDRISQAD